MARDFNGTTDLITLGAAAAINDASSPFTVGAWVNADDTGDPKVIVQNAGATDQGWAFKVATDEKLQFTLPGVGDVFGTATTTLTPATWYYVAVVHSGTNWRFHRITTGGVQTMENVTDASTPGGTGLAGRIGVRYNGSTSDEFFSGSIAQVGVWQGTALSDAQVLAESASCTPVITASGYWQLSPDSPGSSPEPDTSGNGNNGTLTGTTWIDHPIVCGGAPQTICPDADITTTGWTSTPLWSKIGTPADATIITSTAA